MALWPQLSAAESRRGPARGHYKVSGFSWRQYQTSGVTLGAHLALHRTLCHLRQGVQLDALLDQAQRRSREVHRQAEASVQFKRKLLHCARLLGIASELDQRLCVHHSAPNARKRELRSSWLVSSPRPKLTARRVQTRPISATCMIFTAAAKTTVPT